jgi:hypothetical protein
MVNGITRLSQQNKLCVKVIFAHFLTGKHSTRVNIKTRKKYFFMLIILLIKFNGESY